MSITSLAARRVVAAARPVVRRSRRNVRFNSSSAGPTPAGASTSPLVAGAIGGGTVLLGGYAYYHFSGTKDLVTTAHSVHQSLKSAKDTALAATPAPNEVISYLRTTAKSYGGLIPGVSGYIDTTFDAIDELHKTHKDEVEAIVGKTYEELKKTVQDGGLDAQTAGKVLEILKRQSVELGELAKKVGGDIIGPVLDKHPEVKEKLGGGWDDLKSLVSDAKDTEAAKQAQAIYDDTTKQVWEVFSKGLSADGISQAKKLIEEKSQEIQDLSTKAAKELWEKGQKEYLAKAPEDVKKLFSDPSTLSTLVSGSGATAAVVAVWNKVKDISSSKAGFDEKSVKELKDFVQQKVEDAKSKAKDSGVSFDAAWKVAESWLKSVPGGDKALQAVPDIDVAALSKVATSRSDDAKKLLHETYSDVLKVLKEKSEKAKSLGEGAKKDVESEGKGDESKGGKKDDSGKDDKSKGGDDKSKKDKKKN